jgi:alpha-D-xyloside xylohydrolase
MMRPLVMDFRTDVRAQNIGDQYLFGPAILVSPVVEPEALTRRLYLPPGTWYDFWTGKRTEGGRTMETVAPLERLPLFVRAGSIIPFGPDLEYASEKPADPIEVRVYRGASGDFTLYEDEGDTYGYEQGAHATISLHWDDAEQVLRIGDRHGSFPGMLQSRRFRVVFVDENRGVGGRPAAAADREVRYAGKLIEVRR